MKHSFFTLSEGDSPSPYPPSDSDSEYSSTPGNLGLRASIAAAPESSLRAIILKLADSNPRFQRAIQRELSYTSTPDSPPTTPPAAQQRRRHRSKSRPSRSPKSRDKPRKDTISDGLRLNTKTQPEIYQNECIYHPGHLEDEVYEFVSRTPDGVAFKVVRSITMWSCCDEDEWSSGCVVAPAISANNEAIPVDRDQMRMRDLRHSDVFPDSDLEMDDDYARTPLTARPFVRTHHMRVGE